LRRSLEGGFKVVAAGWGLAGSDSRRESATVGEARRDAASAGCRVMERVALGRSMGWRSPRVGRGASVACATDYRLRSGNFGLPVLVAPIG
jgi:hypothetical protein